MGSKSKEQDNSAFLCRNGIAEILPRLWVNVFAAFRQACSTIDLFYTGAAKTSSYIKRDL